METMRRLPVGGWGSPLRSTLLALPGVALGDVLVAQGAGCEDPSSGPDVIVGDVFAVARYAAVGGIGAYSLGVAACNVGDAELDWVAGSARHPVVAQNVYRLEAGRFEQIGLSWVKHAVAALEQALCCDCVAAGTGARLGAGCSSASSAVLHGHQPLLGPRFEVDPHTGLFAYPFFDEGASGDSIYKRIQIALADLDPAQHPGALYFAECQYVAPDDAAAGNQDNNASYRQLVVAGVGGGYELSLVGVTQRTRPAIRAWADHDSSAAVREVRVPGEGLFLVGSSVTDAGDGLWRYEYALQNLDSDRSAGSFRVPIEPGTAVSDAGFHDVAYHSGEPFDGTDWSFAVGADHVEWSTAHYAADPDANALRWGTLYNFRFAADRAPNVANATLGLFKPGTPGEVGFALPAPIGECTTWSYCATSPNSVGPGAILGSSGGPSLAADTFTLEVAGAVPVEFGLFFYGAAQVEVPFGDGLLCVGAGGIGLFRLNPPLLASAEGAAARRVDFGAPPAGSGPGRILPGESWNFQFWYRDPHRAGGSGFNTSDAVQATFCP